MKNRQYRSNKNPSLIITSIQAEWWFSAFLSAGLFISSLLVLPGITFHNPVFNALTGVFRPLISFAGWFFAVIAFFNLFRKLTQRQNPLIKNLQRLLTHHSSNNVNSFFEHQGVYGGSKNNKQDGYLGLLEQSINSHRPESWSIELLKQMEWKLFEDVSAAYYQEKGIRAEPTKLGADGGIDIKLFEDDSGKPTTLVQCKAWNSRLVGIKSIREFLGVMTHEKINKGYYMASGAYTVDAKELASANGITLIDGNMFLTMIQRLPDDAKQRLLKLAIHGDYTTPSCPSCGIKMAKRSGKQGVFWGCQNFPRCRQRLYAKRI